MATFLISNPTAVSLPKLPATASFAAPFATSFAAIGFASRRTRGLTVVRRSGPSTSSYVFAFVFPLSLLAATIFTAIRIDDKLDKDFLEELAVNQAIMEEEEDYGDVEISVMEKPALPRTRNRPKRKAESSSF